MSFDVTICVPPLPDTDREAIKFIDETLHALEGAVPEVFHRLIDRLTARYPCICDLDDDDESGVWNLGPLRNHLGHRVTTLFLGYPRAEEVFPFIVETANSLGLDAFNCQSLAIHRHDSIADLQLTIEDREDFG